MKRAQFIRYTFGARSSEPISQEQQEFYRWIASLLSEEECTLSADKQVLSIPSVAEIGGGDHEAIGDQISGYIRDYWNKPIEVAIFDIARSAPTETIRSEWEMGIATTIANQIIDALSRGEHPLWIILKRARPTENDVIWNPLLAFFHKKNALIIDDEGLIRGHPEFEALINRDEYRAQLLRARHTPIDLLELKLIRRLGHVRIENREKQAYCARHFFDGSECKDEIAQLVRDYIVQYCPREKKPIILYTDPKSHWLRDIVLTLQDCASVSPMSVDDFLTDNQNRPNEIEVPPLLIMPVIDTARTLGSILRDWVMAKLPKPKILSVVSTHGDRKRRGSWRPKFNGEEYEVYYLLFRKRKRYSFQCPLCRLEIPHQASGLVDQYLSLTSYDFWDMVGSTPCPPEQLTERPTHRATALKAVPPIQQMVHENGPWLAKKVINLLEKRLVKGRLKGIPIVHLQESGARPLPLYLCAQLGSTLIDLPNWVRNKLSDPHTKEDEVLTRLRQENPGCAQQLDSVNPDQPVLVLEEFSVTGGTRDAIRRLLDHIGRTVLAHLCVLSFEPRQRRLDVGNSFCLYEFELPKEWLNNG